MRRLLVSPWNSCAGPQEVSFWCSGQDGSRATPGGVPLRFVCTAGVAGPVLPGADVALGYGHARARLGPPGGTHRGHPAAVTRDPQQRPAGSVGRGVVLAGLGLILPWHGAASHPPSLSGAAAEGEGAVCRERGGARSWELIPEVGRQVWVLSRGDEPRAEPPAQGGWAALHPGGTAAKDPVGCAPSERRPRSLPGVHGHAPCLAGATMAVRVLGLGHVVGEQEGWGRGQGASWTGLVCRWGRGFLVARGRTPVGAAAAGAAEAPAAPRGARGWRERVSSDLSSAGRKEGRKRGRPELHGRFLLPAARCAAGKPGQGSLLLTPLRMQGGNGGPARGWGRASSAAGLTGSGRWHCSAQERGQLDPPARRALAGGHGPCTALGAQPGV